MHSLHPRPSPIDQLRPHYHGKTTPALVAGALLLTGAFVGGSTERGQEIVASVTDTVVDDHPTTEPGFTTSPPPENRLVSENGYSPLAADFVSSESGKSYGRQTAVFRVFCKFVGSSKVDRIVKPGVGPDDPEAPHLHGFYGSNAAMDPHSTLESLKAAGTTCSDPSDTSLYWHPMIFDGEEEIEPDQAIIYYEYRLLDNTPRVVQPPKGLMQVVGDAMNTELLDTTKISWQCIKKNNDGEIIKSEPKGEMQICDKDENLSAAVDSPPCWDGVNLDSPDHKSHMAEAVGTECPATHPIPVGTIHARFRWPFSGSKNAYISSDLMTPAGKANKGRSFHIDILTNWAEDRLKMLYEVCLRGARGCAENPMPDDSQQKLPEGGLEGPYIAGRYPETTVMPMTMSAEAMNHG